MVGSEKFGQLASNKTMRRRERMIRKRDEPSEQETVRRRERSATPVPSSAVLLAGCLR
jgi:hypothetical protein